MYYVAVQRDISERKRFELQIKEQTLQLSIANQQLAEANEQLAKLASTDGLTGLSNHRALHQKLAEEIMRATRYQTPLSLLLVDIDRFKSYNEAFGHPAGDEAIQRIAQLMQAHGRQSDMVARHSGEEFAVLLPQTNRAGALALAEELRKAIAAAPWPLREVTISIGSATIENWDGQQTVAQIATDIMQRADEALYLSKSRGRNCVA